MHLWCHRVVVVVIVVIVVVVIVAVVAVAVVVVATTTTMVLVCLGWIPTPNLDALGKRKLAQVAVIRVLVRSNNMLGRGMDQPPNLISCEW